MDILLCGVPGAGKTTLGRYLASKGLVHYEAAGEHKRQLLDKLGINKNLSSFNQIESTLVNSLYFEWLRWREHEWHPTKEDDWHELPLLIDTHASYACGAGFVNLLPATYQADALILLKAMPWTILDRRIRRGRDRDSTKIDFINLELAQEEKAAIEYCNSNRIPFLVIDNTEIWEPEKIVDFIKKELANWERYDKG